MAIVPYPPTVPKPLISVSRTQAQTFQLVQPLRGPGYVKRLNNDAPVTYELNWRLSRDQSAQLQTWFYSMSASGLAMGRNQFQLELDTEWGKLTHTLQITPETFAQNQEAHNVFSYQAVAIARKVPIPQWWLDNESLVNSEFFAQRSLFDLVMNQQLPSAYGENVIAFIDASKESIKGIEFSRSSQATYVDRHGTLLTSPANTPRYEIDGLLIEGASTNELRNSSPVGGVPAGDWYPNSTTYASLVAAVDPQIGDAVTVTSLASGISSRYLWIRPGVQPIVGVGMTVTVSAWARIPLGSRVNSLRFGCAGLSPAFTSHNVTQGTLTRLTHTATVTSANSIGNMYVWPLINGDASPNCAAGEQLITVGCAQAEIYPMKTSYIQTAGSATQRAADALTMQLPAAKRIYRDYTPLGSSTAITETVPYTGELCPKGHLRLLKVLNN